MSQPGRTLGLVTLAQVTRSSVEAAVAEFDRLDREEFLRATGFSRSRSYYLRLNGRLYDSKAIVGYAHGISTGTPLGPGDFSGGDRTVAQRLEALGFEVAYLPPIDWTHDEITVVCAEVEANGWRQLDRRDRRVAELSRLLQSPANHPLAKRGPEFRNLASVARKSADIATRHPEYPGRPTNGNRLDEDVLHAFLDRPEQMRQLAQAIRDELSRGFATGPDLPDPDLGSLTAEEGGVLYRRHLRRERDPEIRRKKIAEAKRRGIPIACEVCSFDFGRVYGARGADYIECHHRTPLHVTGLTVTHIDDLALLCSNCHRMIHRTAPWLTVDELHAIVHSQLVTP
jgi:5-methylcytosine-specific restriction enzyme A